MSVNRIVVLLTPIFVGLSAALSAWITEHFPGAPTLDTTELTAVMIAAAVAAITVVGQWLHGWQKHEQRQAKADADAAAAAQEADAMQARVAAGLEEPHVEGVAGSNVRTAGPDNPEDPGYPLPRRL